MKISVIKSANEVNIGPLQITNEKIAKMLITLNDMKNNLKKRRYTHWVKVGFQGLGSIELGDEPVCIGDYDEYPIAPDTKVIIPIGEDKEHKQYVCSTLNIPILLQNKTLTENEEIIIVYTEELNENSSRSAVNEMLLHAMKKCLFEYQMKAYNDYQGVGINRELLDKRINQILNILPDLERLITQEKDKHEQSVEAYDEYEGTNSIADRTVEEITEYYEENAFVQHNTVEVETSVDHATENIKDEETMDQIEDDLDEEIGIKDLIDEDKDDDLEDIEELDEVETEEMKVTEEVTAVENSEVAKETEKSEVVKNIKVSKENFVIDEEPVRWVKIDMKGNTDTIE